MWFSFLRSLSILWLTSIFVLSCGYSFYQRPSFFKAEWKTIYIPPWKNFSSETELGELLAYELRHKFSQGKFLVPVYDQSRADLVLKGEVRKVYFDPISYETFLRTRERKISFEGRYQLIEAKTGVILMEEVVKRHEIYRVLEFSGTEFLDPGRKEAIDYLVKDLAELIIQNIMLKDLKLN